MEKSSCPECKTEGKLVKKFTVIRVVKKDLKESIGEDDYYLCLDPKCKVGYFSNSTGKTVYRSELKKPLWYKDDANPVIACYCTMITEEDIIRTIIETNLKTMRHIMFHLKGRLGDTCKYKNPTGHCCNEVFNSMIVKGLRVKQNRKILDELNDNLREEVSRYFSIQEDITFVDTDKLDQEIKTKQPNSTCGCSPSKSSSGSCC